MHGLPPPPNGESVGGRGGGEVSPSCGGGAGRDLCAVPTQGCLSLCLALA